MCLPEVRIVFYSVDSLCTKDSTGPANQHSHDAESKGRTPLEKCKQVRVPTTLDVIPVNGKMRFRVKTSFLSKLAAGC